MSRKLHKFQTVAEYQAYSASTEYTTPCVAVVEENNVIYYDYGNNKPQVDLSDYKGEFQESSIGGDKYGKSAITKINYIPSSITDLRDAFNGFTSIVTAPEIPSGVTSLSYTFYYCKSLVNAPEIPSGVSNMGGTFYECRSLVNAPEIPSGVTNMGATFGYCTSLVNSPEIPSGVTNVYNTFNNCTSLKEVTLLITTPLSYNSTLDSCPKLESIYVPDSALEDYRTATGWSQFASKIKPLSSKPS